MKAILCGVGGIGGGLAGQLTRAMSLCKPARMQKIRHPRYLAFLGVTATVALFAHLTLHLDGALVAGFDAGATVFLLSCLPLFRESRSEFIRNRAERDDGGRVLMLLISAVLAVSVLASLVSLTSRNSESEAALTSVVVTLVLVWLFVNMVYAIHYAHLYYDQSAGRDAGGLTFPGDERPVFSDFCYFAFNLGMAFQVSDVVITTTLMRKTVLLHCLLSFAFNLGVLAMVVNVMASAL